MPKTAFKVFVDVDGTVYGPGYTNPVPDAVAENVGDHIFQMDDESDEEPAPVQEEPVPARGPRASGAKGKGE